MNDLIKDAIKYKKEIIDTLQTSEPVARRFKYSFSVTMYELLTNMWSKINFRTYAIQMIAWLLWYYENS